MARYRKVSKRSYKKLPRGYKWRKKGKGVVGANTSKNSFVKAWWSKKKRRWTMVDYIRGNRVDI